MAVKVLFVCLGNICRSPCAEAVFKKLVQEQSLSHQFVVDSAGTSGHHQGAKPDQRMIEHACKRGFKLESMARQVQQKDLENFDHIIVMDDKNLRDVMSTAQEHHKAKIKKLTDFSSLNVQSVPDPYFGGPAGFERVLDIVTDSCRGLLVHLKNSHE